MEPTAAMQPLGTNPVEGGRQLARPNPDRRRRVRHRIHIPAYVTLRAETAGAPDWSEIVDLSEEGMAIQSSSPLQVGDNNDFCLDLSETGAAVRALGKVIWSEPSGRAGIYFPAISPESQQDLKKWLFANAIVAGVNTAAEENAAATGTPARYVDFQVNAALPEFEETAPADYTSVLAGLAAVKKEVEALGPDLDAVLHLVARRAHTFTRATGAAIGLSEGADMLCRATAGRDAPALGARIRIGAGFSGECVRTRETLRCDDAETDAR